MIQIITRTTLILLFYAATAPLSEASYDPLRVKENLEIVTFDLVIHDEKRNRDIPVFVYAPISKTPLPLVLFSHGLGGNRKGSAFLGKHWAVRGYIVAYIQHPGSDDSVWSNTPRLFRWFAMKEAASLDNFSLRVQDVPAVLDQLTLWNASDKSPLFGKIDLTRIGMCGHSFGALTTQAVSGEQFDNGAYSFTDPRIKAAISFSPSVPQAGQDLKIAFARVKIPWMMMTGTQDKSPLGNLDNPKLRLEVYKALPEGQKYQLILEGAEHSVFTEYALPGDRQPRNPNHHRVILALSTAFWDAYLKADTQAKAWLEGSGPSSVLEKSDVFEK